MMIIGCTHAKSSEIPDNIIRRDKNVEFLKTMDVPIHPNLPLVKSERDAKIRTAKETAKRAIVLYCIAGLGHGADRDVVTDWLKEEDLWQSVTPAERETYFMADLSDRSKIQATWKIEAVWTLLWALGKIERIEFPTTICDTELIQSLMPRLDGTTDRFIEEADLRDTHTILDATDLIYRIHWAVRDAQLNGLQVPAQLDPDVVQERHYTLNWLIFYAEHWDDVTTDT